MDPSSFKKTVWNFYSTNKRDSLPWRKNKNSYHILVSEIMLQQTQVDRVIPKYKSWLKKFPNFKSLAQASNKEVLLEWQGLGYNRRGLNLKRAAEEIVTHYSSRLPKNTDRLSKLPGIGPYTAGALLNFVYEIPTPVIETNVRTVFLHHFFKDKENVSDKEIWPLIEETWDQKNPREWLYALMDYGSYLKKEFGNQNKRSKHYTKQSKFKGSNRELRSKILKHTLIHPNYRESDILEIFSTYPPQQVTDNIENMKEEGLIE